jgi:hypothetical protein
MTQTTIEIQNARGFMEYQLVEDGEPIFYSSGNPLVVCPSCLNSVLSNIGQGCHCDRCFHEEYMDGLANYDN